MPNVTLGTYSTIANVLTTDLNALAGGAYSAASAAIDNRTDLKIFEQLELAVTFASNPVAGEVVEVYMVESLDETNYSESTAPPDTALVGVFPVRANTSLQRIVLGDPVPLKPGYYKYVVKNNTSQAFSATGHTLKRRAYSLTTSA